METCLIKRGPLTVRYGLYFYYFLFGGGEGGGGVGQCMQGELNTVRSIKCMARIHRLSYHIVSFSHFSFFSRELSAMESRETFR